MNRDQAFKALSSPRASERLIGARALLGLARPDDSQVISEMLAVEQAVWVKSALESVLGRLSGVTLVEREPSPEGVYSAGADEIINRTKHETIGQVIHELSPAVGRIKMAAMEEVANYGASKTEAALHKITRLIDMFGRWRRVNEPLDLSQVTLLDLLQEIVDDEEVSGVPIRVVRDSDSHNVLTDAECLRVAVANGLRNAVQAVLAKGANRSGEEEVCISYGRTDRDFWVSILDDGVGLRGPAERVIAATASTKPGHSGMGLPVAVEAVDRLGGKVRLRPAERGGTQFLIEVPLGMGHENTIC